MKTGIYSHLIRTLKVKAQEYGYFSLPEYARMAQLDLQKLPFSIRVLLEGALRHCGELDVTQNDVAELANWKPTAARQSTSFFPGRVLLQDLTGVPVMVDLASLRSALARAGGDPNRINPLIPVDLVVDHSIQVDEFGTATAFEQNKRKEFERNHERYAFLRWAQRAFQNVNIVPPATGIVHQLNIEYLAKVAMTRREGELNLVFPDTLVGTDSHTTMVNGLGVLGWGVGGIEAISAMLGQPIELPIPDVLGFRLTGELPEGTTPTDLTLTIVQILRKKGVVDKFVEFYGPGLDTLSLADRCMIANMAPEYGATLSYFPVDEQTLAYLRLTGRSKEQIDLVEAYYQTQGMFRAGDNKEIEYSDTLELNLGEVQPSLAGPKRPQDRVNLGDVQVAFQKALGQTKNEGGFGIDLAESRRNVDAVVSGQPVSLKHGALVIASITSCTNTSNPYVLIAAGLMARKAVEKGLKISPTVKTSFSPGSRVVTAYLEDAGLMEALDKLGFNLTGYGCMTCIGNSGPLADGMAEAIKNGSLVAASVLSGNRNFEGRVHPLAQANYLASPPLVVAYALAGTVDINLTADPLGVDRDGQPVYLKDLWPTRAEILEVVELVVKPELFREKYSNISQGSQEWNQIDIQGSVLFDWDKRSTYLQEPPFYSGLDKPLDGLTTIHGLRALAVFGDSVTTDHISPAGSIPEASPAGRYLKELGIALMDFNTYGARRGNDRVMARGTFANIRIKNLLLPGIEGGETLHFPQGERLSIFDAAQKYRQENVPLLIFAGKEYGTGSSRDWAAKGPALLGVRAVIAESFERIHRSNLAGMGILPLQFLPGVNLAALGLTGREEFELASEGELRPDGMMLMTAKDEYGCVTCFRVKVRLNSEREVNILHSGGILQAALREMLH